MRDVQHSVGTPCLAAVHAPTPVAARRWGVGCGISPALQAALDDREHYEDALETERKYGVSYRENYGRPPRQVPGWLVVTLVPSELAADGSLSTKKGLEDHAATAAAIQNFMVSLAASGVGSK